MRTQEEIIERIKDRESADVLGFEIPFYMCLLTKENVRQFCKPDADLTGWDHKKAEAELDTQAKEYMPFWLEKIENQRGISVCRGTSHFTAWKWSLGHSDADTFPGSVNGPDGGWYQRTAYDYIKQQMDSGEWGRLTAEANKREPEREEQRSPENI